MSTLHLFNSWPLNVCLMLFRFVSRQKLHLLLNLSGLENFLMNLHKSSGFIFVIK